MSEEHTIHCPQCGAACEPAAGAASGEVLSCDQCGADLLGLPGGTVTAGTRDTLESLRAAWGETLTLDAPQGQTIKTYSGSPESSHSLSIKLKNLVTPGGRADPSTDYEILDVLGEGGMAIVYSGRQSSLDRRIAIKMIKADIDTGTPAKDKFLSEAAVTGELEHPNIVPVYDLGADEEGNLFYAMKQVKGTSWKEAIKKETRSRNIEILMRVADAVAFAHSRGVIHRDLKPVNVMLGDYGEVLVMDWGLALPLAGEVQPAERADTRRAVHQRRLPAACPLPLQDKEGMAASCE